MNRVARRNGEHRFVCGRELPVENGWSELVPLRSAAAPVSGEGGSELPRCGTSWIIGVSPDNAARYFAALNGAGGVLGSALVVLGEEMNFVAVY